MDAGIAPIRDMQPLLDVIEEQDILLIDHDDKSIWPFYNITFTADKCIEALGASRKELLSPHIRAGLFGYKVGGRYQALVEDAFKYSLDPDALVGEKHPSDADKMTRAPSGQVDRTRAVEDPAFRAWLTPKEMRRLFGFFGHRHDQPHTCFHPPGATRGAPRFELAMRFCVADDFSSGLSRQNWMTGFAAKGAPFTYEVDDFYTRSGAICISAGGSLLNDQGLDFGLSRRNRAIILGNGPSLKDFDFARFEGLDVFGMNAAYRHWDRIGWYPQYFSCLDTVLGLSHATEIRRLIENAPEYGIKQFLLRQNLIDAIGEVKNSERVICFDLLRRGAEMLSAPTISTGSHTAGWAAYLGYEEIFLLGIDCNYVEIIDGAVRGKGTELEITKPVEENPNYFFADYQKPGDKYNVPNPGRDIHLTSWREIASLLPATKATIINANMVSKVDAFPFCGFEDIEAGGPISSCRRRKCSVRSPAPVRS